MTDREQLQNFAEALGSRATCLRRDDCGDWHILGRKGHVYVYDATAVLLVYHPGSARGWTFAKASLGFCRVTQDGDDEGCLVLDHLPTRDEASTIRRVLVIAKKRDVSPEEIERLAKTGFKSRTGTDLNGQGYENGD
jgi:hypothetical protein